MKTSIHVWLLSGCLLSGCSKDSNVGGPGGIRHAYPMGIGSRWKYDFVSAQYNFRPRVPGTTFRPDTIWGRVQVDIIGLEKLPLRNGTDSLLTTVFQELDSMLTQPSPGEVSRGVHYMSVDSTGLYVHAYRGASSMGLPSAVRRPALSGVFGDRIISPFPPLLDGPTEASRFVLDDSLRREIPPLQVLRYPLTINAQWTFRSPVPFRIDKRMVAQRSETVNGVTHNVYVVRWLYDMNNDGQWDEDIDITDYISGEGLVKRTINMLNIQVTTEQNTNIGIVDMRNEYSASSLNVH